MSTAASAASGSGGALGGITGALGGAYLGGHMPNGQAKAAQASTNAQLLANYQAENQDRWNSQAGMQNNMWASEEANNLLSQGLQQGNSAIQGNLAQAQSYLNPYYQSGLGANSMLQNALGLNGAQGNQTATSAFQAQPGYQWALGQGENLVTNNAAASGLLNSTQFANSLTGFGQGMANQQYGNWEDRLTGMANQGAQAGGAMSTNQMNAGNNLSNNWMNAASRGSGNMMQLGGTTANTYNNLGQNMASMSENQGNIAAGGINQYANAVQNQMQGYMGLGAMLGSSLGSGGLGTAMSNMFNKQPAQGGATSNYNNGNMVGPSGYANQNGGGSQGDNGFLSWLFNRGQS